MDWLKQTSISSQKFDSVFYYSMGLSVAFLVFITALMIYFVWRYSRRRHPVAEQIEGHTGLEIVWTVTPLILFLTIFYYGWTNFEYIRQAPRDSMVVNVTARQWAYAFQYPNGKQSKILFAPVDKPMKMAVRSSDVVHGFYIPSFRVKIDAVPGSVNTTWFQATKVGSYDIECTVICGIDHSRMLSKVVVVPEDEFKAWYFGGEDAPEPGSAARAASQPPASSATPAGLALMEANSCLVCHSVDGEPSVGPTLKGLYGKQVEVIVAEEARTITVDEAYLLRAIQTPMSEVVSGYPPAMPEMPLERAEADAMVSYIKSLK